MDWKTHKIELENDPEFRVSLKETRMEYEIARALIEARIRHNLSQKELAEKLGTKQSVISRVENAKTTPSLSFLKRLAKVLDTELIVKFGKYSSSYK